MCIGNVGYPYPKDFKKMERLNMIHNCPITPEKISAINKIFSLDVASLKEEKRQEERLS
jgi:hypothetical protein